MPDTCPNTGDKAENKMMPIPIFMGSPFVWNRVAENKHTCTVSDGGQYHKAKWSSIGRQREVAGERMWFRLGDPYGFPRREALYTTRLSGEREFQAAGMQGRGQEEGTQGLSRDWNKGREREGQWGVNESQEKVFQIMLMFFLGWCMHFLDFTLNQMEVLEDSELQCAQGLWL